MVETRVMKRACNDAPGGDNPSSARKKICRGLQVSSLTEACQNKGDSEEAAAELAGEVTCRLKECKKVIQTLKTAVKSQRGIALYIPGQPGTGKTHTIRRILSNFRWREMEVPPPACTIVNCMELSSSLPRVCLAGVEEAARGSKRISTLKENSAVEIPIICANSCDLKASADNQDAMQQLRKIAKGTKNLWKGMYILVLDELDQASKRASEAVSEIFSLSMLPRSRLIVISIANRLDLAQKIIQPTSTSACVPIVVPFHSYTARQLLELLQTLQRDQKHLRRQLSIQELYSEHFQPKALELVARRIASSTGDMRSAMAICNAARALQSSGTRSPAADDDSDRENIAVEDSVRGEKQLINVTQVAEALRESAAGGSAQAQGHVSRIQKLPVQQQLLLCTLAIARGAAESAHCSLSPAPGTPMPAEKSPRVLGSPLVNRTPEKLSRVSTLPSMLRSRPQTPNSGIGTGFGLSGTMSGDVKKADSLMVNRSLLSPCTPKKTPNNAFLSPLSGLKRLGATPSYGKGNVLSSNLTVEELFKKYKVRGREAGLAVVESSLQLEDMIEGLKATGLLEAVGKKGIRGSGKQQVMVQLCVSTDDVKHALCSNHMLQPLIAQLP